jgi:hypothetical protein
LGQITLAVQFSTVDHFRTKILTFEVVRFHETYHAILGRPCYAKFMVVPNYTYLKLKMLGLHGSSPTALPSSALRSAMSSVASSPQ